MKSFDFQGDTFFENFPKEHWQERIDDDFSNDAASKQRKRLHRRVRVKKEMSIPERVEIAGNSFFKNLPHLFPIFGTAHHVPGIVPGF